MEGVDGLNFDDFRNKEVGLWGEGVFAASAMRRNVSASASLACFFSALSAAACMRCSCYSSVIVDIVVIMVLLLTGPSLV